VYVRTMVTVYNVRVLSVGGMGVRRNL